MEFIPPRNFRYTRTFSPRFPKADPRSLSFSETEVAINLRKCSQIQPPVNLWCAVYLLLSKQRGCDCLLALPEDTDLRMKLRGVGLLGVLRETGITVEPDDAGGQHPGDSILPLTRFDGLMEAAALTNRVEDSLYNSGQGSANIHPAICELFSELVNNATEHSESSIGAYAFVQFWSSDQGRRFVCGVADGGIGIQKSIEYNTALNHFGYEWAAIDLATKELVSGTASKTRGIGLFSVFEDMRIPGRELMIHSGKGILTSSSDSQIRMIPASLFPGTMVYFTVPA